MGHTDYIVRFKGDYSALQKDLNKINAETTKLEDDEVIIKLNYDGNIKEFNKVFDQISKMHPELGIQFQYNVNEKLLRQETDKLKQLSDLKLDIDDNKVQNKLENLADNVKVALKNNLSKEDITSRLKEFFGYYNTATKAGAKNIQPVFDQLVYGLEDSFKLAEDDIKNLFDEIWEGNDIKPIELFKIDKSLTQDISDAQERVNDIKDTLASLEKQGASKSGLPSELQKVQDEIKILRSDINEMQGQLKNLSGEAFDEMTESIKKTNEQLDTAKERLKIIQDFLKNNGNSEVLNFTEALNKLQGMLSAFYKENNGDHISSFWDELIDKAQNGDAEVLRLLSDLRLLKDTELPEKINAGMVKSGGLIGDDYTVLTTKIRSDKFSGNRLKNAEELKKRLDAISNSGVNAAKILSIVSDEANNLFVEIQETAPGKMLGQIYGQTEKDWVNTDFFEATDAEILKLIVDLETLRKAGIGVELNAGNLLYEKGKGFTIIDMDLEPLKDYEETISEAQDVLFDSIRQFYELQTDESGNITAEAQTAITALDNFSQKFGDIAEKKKAVIDQLSTAGASNQQITINDAAKEATQKAADALQEAQDSNSPAELTKPLGKDFGEGYAEGIRESLPDIVEACKDIVMGAYNALKETSDAKNGEGNNFLDIFINNLKESLDNAAPTIQEKINEVFSKINIDNKSEKSSLSSIGSEDFQSQFQNAINETGEYIIKVYGELIDDFKSRLQNSIDETGIYHVDIEGWLYDTFHDGLQRDIDGQERYNIEVNGKLVETFKDIIQEAIDGLGAFPIEVKPYIRKGSEIEEVDLPGGNKTNLSSGTTTPSQQFDNEVQQNLVMLENYKNTVAEIDRLKLEPETDETKAKLEELNKLADYFVSKITVIRGENGDEVNTSMMLGWGASGGWSERLKRDYSEEQRKEFLSVAKERSGLQISSVASEFHGISDEITNIEAKSEGLRNALVKDLIESSAYVSKLRAAYLGVAEANDELKTAKPGSEDFKDYTDQLNTFLSKYPELEKFKDALGYYDKAPEFVKSDDWLDFLATLPQAHTYLESIGYDFDKINQVSNETPVSTESTNAETKALLSKKEIVEQLRAELNLTKKAAEDLFDQQGYAKTDNRYQIEQAAVDELIASLKEKQQTEESTNTTGTSAITASMEEEKNAISSAVDAEKQKFDELKNKISKTIPSAIEKKNKAFEKERNLVAKIVEDEVDYMAYLKDSIDDTTEAIGKQQNTVKNLKTDSGSKKKKNKSNEVDVDALLQQHYTEQRRNYFQSIGQKSDIQKDMSAYYTQLEKESAKAYSNAETKATSLLKKVEKLKNSGKYSQSFQAELEGAEAELNTFLSQLKNGTISFEDVNDRITALGDNIENTLAKKAFKEVKLAAEKSLTNVGLKIDQIIAKNTAMGEEFKSRFMALKDRLGTAETVADVQKITAAVNTLESELITAGKTGVSFFDQVKQRLRDMNSKYIAQYFSFQDIIRYARQAFTTIQDLNIQMVELAKVSEQSLEQIKGDFQSYAETAKDLGSTITDTISATADWARLGYNVPDAKELARVALLYKNVGDGIDITAANESLISTLQGYQMQADEAEHIVDVFNEVANNYAIDTAGIGEALQRSAASLNAANTSLEQSVALVTAANTVVQNPESVGTTFKTNLYVFMYSNVHIEYI